jgi:photosystem II stability/assembly factor-like uncharacterized protein
VRTNRLKWALIALAGTGLLGAVESEAAGAEATQVAGPALPAALQSPLNSVYCSSPQSCLAIGSSFAATTSDGGRSWASHPMSHAGMGFDELACPTPEICMAIGPYQDVIRNRKAKTETFRAAIAKTTDGGRTWTMAAPLPKGVGRALDAISCATRSYCVLAGSSLSVDGVPTVGYALATTNLGRSWRHLKIPRGDVLPGITCEMPGHCVAVAEGTFDHIATTNDGGSTWRQSSGLIRAPPDFVSSPTCIGLTRCYIVGWSYQEENLPPVASIIQTDDGGRTSINDVLPPNTSVLSQISCASAADCVAAGGGWNHAGGSGPPDLLTTSNGGTTWVARSLPASIIDINGISCPTVTWCMMVGSEGPNTFVQHPSATVAVTDDGGVTWTVEWPMPSP